MPADNKLSQEERERIMQESLLEDKKTPEESPKEDDPFDNGEDDKSSEESKDTADDTKDSDAPDIKERYKASTQEAQILHARQRKFNETVQKAAQLADPTEEDLAKEYSDWEVMTDTEKRLAKDNLINKRRFALVHEASQAGQEIEKWSDEVDGFLATAVAKYPQLNGKEDLFRAFSMKETRRGLDFDILTKSFLYDATEMPRRKKSGSLLEMGSGGSGAKPPADTIDAKQASVLRTTNHKLYQKMVREGKIKIDV